MVALATEKPVMLDVGQVASLLNCSSRHVHRLRDGGLMPAPVKLGNLIRWNRTALDAWIADGCPRVTQAKTSKRRVL